MESTQEGEWEATLKKSGSSSNVKAWGHSEGAPRQGYGTDDGSWKSPGNNWAQATDFRKWGGRDNSPKPELSNRGPGSEYMAPPPAIPSPLQHGWQRATRGGSSSPQPRFDEEIKSNGLIQDGSDGGYDSESDKEPHHPDDGSDDDELLEDSDDDLSDDYDSDVSRKSCEKRNKNRWFRAFFEVMDSLTVEEINEQSRQWHCPACHDGPGAINWYKGLQPLMTHAKTKRSSRVKLHRELAELLEEELQRKGTSVIPTVEASCKWKGLREPATDHEIVWPPMVVIVNTLFEKDDDDDDDKWLGMGNQELLEYFSEYAAVKARRSYGPNGHQGMSVLIFETSAMGYWEAARLHKHFITGGRDRDAWELHQMKLYPGVKRQLYGYLACKEDLDIFNHHFQGKSKLKFKMRSYQQMVVLPMKQMSKDNQTLVRLKKKFVAQEQRLKDLEETLALVSQRLREKFEEDRMGRLGTNIQHEEYKEKMDHQEQFSKEHSDKVQKTMEKLQEEHTKEEHSQRKEEELRSAESQVKAEREKLLHGDEATMVELELERKHLAEKLKLREECATPLA